LHGLVAARLGDCDMALRYFKQTASIDLADTHAAIAGGVHIGALGGLWQTAVFGFAGLSLLSDGVAFDPHLPASWNSLGFCFQWHGRHVKIRIGQGDRRLEATLESGASMTLVVDGVSHELRPDRTLRVFAAKPKPPTRLGQSAIEPL
jgi:trehalose/maltose hydrolase-like predicted phosphorylase